MELNGAKVRHKTFGCGLITHCDGRYFTVSFEHIKKDFVYPDAFKMFLVIEDPAMDQAIQNDLALAQESIVAAENARRQFSLFQSTEQAKTAKKSSRGSAQKARPACGLVKSPSGHQYFFVFQNRTFDAERQGGYIWAPKPNANGRDLWHWKLMGEVHAGDMIIHIVNKNIVAISIASTACYTANLPGEAQQEQAAEDAGRRVDCTYYMLESPIAISDFRDAIVELQPTQYAPLNALGRGNTGYLFASNPALSQFLFDKLTLCNTGLQELAQTLGLTINETPEETPV